jgi:hypothetical protein
VLGITALRAPLGAVPLADFVLLPCPLGRWVHFHWVGSGKRERIPPLGAWLSPRAVLVLAAAEPASAHLGAQRDQAAFLRRFG